MLTGDQKERIWQGLPSDYEATARLMERHGFPELAREWWWMASEARQREREIRPLGKRWPVGCSSFPA